MNEEKLFAYLKKRPTEALFDLLKECYASMQTKQKRDVFGHLEEQYMGETFVDGQILLAEIAQFKEDSLKHKYYAPFDIHSKNYMDIPEETDMWFEKVAELLIECEQLSYQDEHIEAIKCFRGVFECIEMIYSGEEIIFADEYGMWMLPINEKPCIKAYITSAAKMSTPEDYAELMMPLIIRDYQESCDNNVYEKAVQAANTEQKTALEKRVKQRKLKTL